MKRPGIQKLISETDKFDIVLVYKLDRLSRSQRDTLYLIEEIFLPNNVDFVSVQESFDTSSPFGKAMIGLLAVFAQLEREQIKERTRMGRVARAKAGLYHGGGYIPIGYNYKDGHLTINPYEAEQVKKIFSWYLEGASLKAIADRLQDAGYTTRYGDYTSWTTIRNILENKTYLGNLHFADVTVENTHEALVTEEQFNMVQKIRNRKREIYGTWAFQSKHLLTGLIYCGHCGGRYYLRNSGKYKYYSCYSRTKQIKAMIKDPDCQNKNWKGDELESAVDARIREILNNLNLVRDIMSHKPEKVQPTESTKLEKRIAEIDKQINKLMGLYQKDEIPPEILGEQINQLYTEKVTLQETLPKEEKSEEVPFDLVEALIENASQIWDFADESQKRRILQSLIKRIVLTDDNIDIEWSF